MGRIVAKPMAARVRSGGRGRTGQSGPALRYLPAGRSFLDPDRVDAGRPDDAKVVVIPFGLEASVSYGSGTTRGR